MPESPMVNGSHVLEQNKAAGMGSIIIVALSAECFPGSSARGGRRCQALLRSCPAARNVTDGHSKVAGSS